MDIKDILSPSERDASRSTLSTPASPKDSPFKHVQRAHSGPLISGYTKAGPGASSLSQTVVSSNRVPAHILSPARQSVASPLISPVPNPSSSPFFNRASSTQSMDTLADVASMQNHQPPRSAPSIARASQSSTGPLSMMSNPRASIDINMLDTPKQSSRVDFSGTSLPEEQQTRLTELAEHIQEVPSALESHVEVIRILHEGLVAHIYPSSDPRSRRDPRQYDLIRDLRLAREQMEKLFAVGEELWSDWIQDESLLAQSAEERIAVVEQCRKAVEEEVGSVKLWSAYCDWIHHCYVWAHSDGNENEEPDEEKLIGKEIFSWQLVLDVWQEAIDQTSRDLASSHLIWKKYLDVRFPNVTDKLTPEQCSVVLSLFQDRLRTPHVQWDETFQRFSGFVSNNLESQYEQIMMDTNRSAAASKEAMAARESYEAALQQTRDSGDLDAEYRAFQEYITWEQTPQKRRKPDLNMVDTLYKRAELRFSSDPALWEAHTVFLVEKSLPNALPLLERATKHCPWSGSLWVHYLLTSERLGQSFQETEEIKHKATSTGLLEAAGIEEVIAVHAAWCSYLRRRSARPEGGEEDIDVAEMGIRSSIENVSSLGVKLGLGEAPGSSFRLRRIYITFLTDSGRWDNARHEFDTSIREYGKSYQFWLQFYHWEMMRWRRFAAVRQEASSESMGVIEPPELATAVLKKALDQSGLDYPEPIIQQFLVHCEDHMDAEELQQAIFRAKSIEVAVAAKRQAEAAQFAQAVEATEAASESHQSSSKRKRGSNDDSEQDHKKLRNDDPVQPSVEPSLNDQPKRDREHATVLVQNLPEHITDVKVRQYFSNCGVIRSLKVLRDDGISAVVEFEDDDAAKYALSRDGQELDGAVLSVALDTGSTLYVTNYKPEADEAYIRSLLAKYGDILSVRFPSLQVNRNRRFCYVQFKEPDQAQQATELDGNDVDGLPLVCQISNPGSRKPRDDKASVNDGSTIFLGQLNFNTTEEQLRQAFEKFGEIQMIRMPRDHVDKTRNKGIAFITFESATEANAALAMHHQDLHKRKIVVKIANNTNRSQSVAKRTVSPAVEDSTKAASGQASLKDRQVFLTGVPDTVNSSRIKALGEQYGKVLHVVLKTNHQGAILEYSTAAEAGEAAIRLDGVEIDPTRTIRIVTEQEMKAESREQKVDDLSSAKPKTDIPKTVPIGAMGPVRRPGHPGKKGGHLGQRSAAIFQNSKVQDVETNGVSKKSNDDFRNMLKK